MKSGYYQGLITLYGKETGKRLDADVLARLKALLRYLPPQANRAMTWQYQKNILPGVALYRCLLGQGQPAAQALEAVEKLIVIKAAGQRKMINMIGWLPAPFDIFRFLIKKQIQHLYPPEGWEVEWRQDTRESLDFDITRCVCLQTVKELGHPELAPCFCRLDDKLGAEMADFARFERHGTLAMGAACCDFSFQRVD